VTVSNRQGNTGINIYRKLTATDTTIYTNSCIRREPKASIFRSLLHCLDNLVLHKTNKLKELTTVTTIIETTNTKKKKITTV
jgi:hypothetical protein